MTCDNPTRLIIVRHGNTFRKDEIPTRVGKNTDIDLVEDDRAKRVGNYFLENDIKINKIIASPLKRCMQTAAIISNVIGFDKTNIRADHSMIEIDYGPDENKTEEAVEIRLGKEFYKNNPNINLEEARTKGAEIIDLWNNEAILPSGWEVDTNAIIKTWIDFANNVAEGETVLVVSSNGIIRFAPYITANFEAFAKTHDIKVKTGGICIFEKNNNTWKCKVWNG